MLRLRSLAALFAVATNMTAMASAQSQQAIGFDSRTAAIQPMQLEMADIRVRWAERVARGAAPATIIEPAIRGARFLVPQFDVTKGHGVPDVLFGIATGTVGVAAIHITLTSPTGHQVTGFISVPQYPAQPSQQLLKL